MCWQLKSPSYRAGEGTSGSEVLNRNQAHQKNFIKIQHTHALNWSIQIWRHKVKYHAETCPSFKFIYKTSGKKAIQFIVNDTVNII